ncbi:MAG: hypothetical protein ACXAC2_25700, partial [Candidatus Kariarchaeaceae archaeon]
AWDAISNAVEQVFTTIVNLCEEAWENIEKSVEKVIEEVTNFIERTAKLCEQVFHDLAKLIEKIVYFIGNVITTIIDLIAKLGACLAGKVAYSFAKNANILENLGKHITPLPTSFKDRLPRVFGSTKFEEVMIVENAILIANFFGGSKKGMTFGNVFWYGMPCLAVIFLVGSFDQNKFTDRRLLVHELVHVKQLRRFGYSDSNFACAYGIGYYEGGFSYENNPLEVEAYSFTDLKSTAIQNM